MRTMIMLLFTCLTATSFASFNGKWAGQVNYSDSDGYEAVGDESVFLFPYAPGRIYFADTFWGYQLDMEVQDGKLLMQGTEIGTISDNEIQLLFDNGECSWKNSMYLKSDGKISFNDSFSCVDGYFDKTEGVLSPASGAMPTVHRGAFKLR